jgi:DNA-binding response OmpR family regulator
MNDTTILIIEDDYDIRSANRAALELEGYQVMEADTLSKGRQIVEESKPDLIILDILLPDGNGLQYCEELRGKSGICILFLSALNTKSDLLAGLRAGGDDYMSKPYDMDELLLRVEALLRRGKFIGIDELEIQLYGLEMNYISRHALLNGRDLLLKPKEFALLEVLVRSRGRTVPVEELYESVWDMNPAGDVRTVKEHISRIRSKLGENSRLTIVSERGKGYILEDKDGIKQKKVVKN